MIRLARRLAVISLLLIATGLMTTATQAGKEPAVVRALLDSSAVNAVARPTYTSLDVAADGTITLSGLAMAYQVDEESDSLVRYHVEALVLADVSEISQGVFKVGDARWTHMTVTSGGVPVAAIPLVTGRSVYIYQPSETPGPRELIRSSSPLAEEFLIPEAMVLIAGHGVVLEGLGSTWQGDPLTGAGTSRFEARSIHIPGGVLGGDDNPLAMAGYDELRLSVEGMTSNSYAEDTLGFDLELRLNGRDVGSVIVELGADGIPLALVGAIEVAEPDADKLLPFAGDVSLKRARIRFEDESLTGRLLALMAEIEDMDVAEFVAELTEDVEMGLAEMLEPELARQVSDSLTAFLIEPKAITIALAPKQPVRFDQMMAGLEDPLALIELLQLTITAND